MKDDDIIEDLRRVAVKLGKTSVSLSEFKDHGRFSTSTIRSRFGTWNAAVERAGLEPIPFVTEKETTRPSPVTDDELLKEILRVTKEIGRLPTHSSMRNRGKYTETPYRNRWGSLREACEVAYEKYGWPLTEDSSDEDRPWPAAAKTGSQAVQKHLPNVKTEPPTAKPQTPQARPEAAKGKPQAAEARTEPTKVKPQASAARLEPPKTKPQVPKAKPEPSAVKTESPAAEPEPLEMRPEPRRKIVTPIETAAMEPERTTQPSGRRKVQFGEPIDFRGVRFGPVNKQGVVHMFGMVCRELGFLIETIRPGFPDCEAKRSTDKEGHRWEQVLIGFDYRSSSFREHAYLLHECDLIVCWLHDWKECPVEVLELRSKISGLPNR